MPNPATSSPTHRSDEERRRRQWSAPEEAPPFPYPEKQHEDPPLMLEKSNVLLLGPSGTGKTLLAKTLARRLDVPFSMSDCTPFTQAGYIGEDADVCVARLLAAADYDVAKAERGIICLDEIDKIATAKVSHGKDVSGEGVQQALLKIIEGTTIQVQAKGEKGSGGGSGGRGGAGMGFGQTPPGGFNGHPGFPGGPSSGGGLGSPMGGKAEIFNVRTDNILFIFTGAFVGLHKIIMDRISKGSIGFGATVRTSNPELGAHETMLKGERELFRKHLPYYVPEDQQPSQTSTNSSASANVPTYNTLDLTGPNDLQKYGLIPELTGRIPISCALSALDEESLVRVLTEPRNSILHQYEHLLSLSGIELRFTSAALREIAKVALDMGTGARGLRTVVERLLGDAMFEAPGTSFELPCL
jgi:ATP-dependent Clp protease ATP-binding subunit ClpX